MVRVKRTDNRAIDELWSFCGQSLIRHIVDIDNIHRSVVVNSLVVMSRFK